MGANFGFGPTRTNSPFKQSCQQRGPLHRGVQKSSCEGGMALGHSKPLTYATALCGYRNYQQLPTSLHSVIGDFIHDFETI